MGSDAGALQGGKMTKEEAIKYLTRLQEPDSWEPQINKYVFKALEMAIEALKQQPCEDTISRTRAIERLKLNFPISDGADNSRDRHRYMQALADIQAIREMPSVTPQPKVEKCKNCKWWKDSDGVYRRGVHAKSKCPINRKEVLEGKGYCYMFEPKKSEKRNDE